MGMSDPSDLAERRWEGPSYWRSIPTADLADTAVELRARCADCAELLQVADECDAEVARRTAAAQC